ncbi:MAG: glycosyltransferase [Clostridium sp.]|uniref:glycosyltransferase n=1 Tax=Clostridium sp. TaxID=1506 RepID=UPI0029129F34|nr:glycosyltransferase [Clostridium sp.]MDU6365066.1 glycosyltransferase [Clostridium sp.]
MNILHINTRYIGGGGAAAIANLLHNEINKYEGMKSRFLYGRGESNDSNSIKASYEFESYISAGVTRVFGRSLNRGISKEVKKEIDNADIIHIHNLHGYYINYESLIDYIVEKDKKVIWTLHDTWSFTGRCAFTFGCEKWKSGCGNCTNLNMYPTTKKDISDKLWKKKKDIFNKLDKKKTVIVTPSKWLKGLVKESYLKEFNVKVINNGVEESKYINIDKNIIRKELGLPIDKKIVLFVAADPNDERKGIKYILDVLDGFNEDVIFISMGKEINIKNDKLIQLGYKTCRDDIYKVYRASDLFVIPSLDDNFPTTVLEAFANGTPVVGFESGGIKEQIMNEKDGYLVKKTDSRDLKDKIDKCITNNIDRSLSDKCINKFNELYSIDIFKNKYLNLFSSLYNKEV